jgi:hypothetical protein
MKRFTKIYLQFSFVFIVILLSKEISFAYIPPPTITSLSATSGCGATAFTINGIGLTGATAANVKVGGVSVTSITSNSGTQMVVVPVAGSSGTVSVTTGGGTFSDATYSYTSHNYPGKFGNALSFDGSNDYVSVPKVVIPSNTGEYTVSVWAKENSHISWFVDIMGQGHNFYLGYSNSGLIRVGDTWTPNIAFPTDLQWHHYTVVRSSSNSFLYIDGALVADILNGPNNWHYSNTILMPPEASPWYGDTSETKFKIGSNFNITWLCLRQSANRSRSVKETR